MKNLTLTICFLINFALLGQVNDIKARDLLDEAIDLMDNGDFSTSIKKLELAKEIEPNNYIFDYEIGFAHYLKKDYKSSLKVFKKTAKYEVIPDQVYQMLGNLYDINGSPKKALKAYQEGLNKFPNSGRLYLESGNVYLNQQEYNQALNYYEKGIQVDPSYPSNYYRATLLYLNSDKKIYGMIYGETFMNLERGSQRTVEISKSLYDTYKSQITFKDDTVNVSFYKRVINISIKDLKGDLDKLMESIGSMTASLGDNFASSAYENNISIAALGTKEINIKSLDTIRTRFIENYFKNGLNEKYEVPLFKFHKRIIDEGFGEAYNYWLLSIGDEEGFDKWVEENRGTWVSFLDWYENNFLPIEENSFYSTKYE